MTTCRTEAVGIANGLRLCWGADSRVWGVGVPVEANVRTDLDCVRLGARCAHEFDGVPVQVDLARVFSVAAVKALDLVLDAGSCESQSRVCLPRLTPLVSNRSADHNEQDERRGGKRLRALRAGHDASQFFGRIARIVPHASRDDTAFTTSGSRHERTPSSRQIRASVAAVIAACVRETERRRKTVLQLVRAVMHESQGFIYRAPMHLA